MIPMAMSTAAIGAGLVIVGAGIGVGVLWAAGLQSIARQPEMQTKLQAVMLIGAALIEGTALFALVICLMTK
jgi:F-type H+-transporting ATPase subunit c